MRFSPPAGLCALAALLLAVTRLAPVTAPSRAKPARHAASRAVPTKLDASNWGCVTAPAYGTSERGVYSGAELFAGPDKLGSYFAGVLPNGRFVRPAGESVQVGTNPLGLALTPDGRYLIASDDDERQTEATSLRDKANLGGFSLTVLDTTTFKVVSRLATDEPLFVGLQVTGSGPYTVWASGGPSQSVHVFTLSQAGEISGPTAQVAIRPTLAADAGFVSHYAPAPGFPRRSVPSGFRAAGQAITFPADSGLSPDGRYLYVACNGDNSVAVIDTTTRAVVKQIPVGYFPYGVAVSEDGSRVLVSNWGVTEYRFRAPAYDSDGRLTALGAVSDNQPDGFYVPRTSAAGRDPKTSSVSIIAAPGGDPARAELLGSTYLGSAAGLDRLHNVGGTHPSALTVVRRGNTEVLFVAESNIDALGRIVVKDGRRLPDIDLSPLAITELDGHRVHGTYPNALAVSRDNTRLYVAEAGTNSVAVLDTTDPLAPRLLGRVPTGWYPTGVRVSPDGRYLYVVNAKGIGEDVNPATAGNPSATGLESFADSNYIFGTVQKIDLAATRPDNTATLANSFAVHAPVDTSVVPAGGAPSKRIRHVVFILHENKTFDSMLGSLGSHFGPYASLVFNNRDGSAFTARQFNGIAHNTQLLATTFAAAANYYSDSEESDAGHQFSASGTATDYTEKTLLVKKGRELLSNKNMEPEDYPEGGYIFNNAARHNVSFKDYGALIRIAGTDTGDSTPTTVDDPASGLAGLPQVRRGDRSLVTPPANTGDVTSATRGLGQSYFLALPILAVLGDTNSGGEPHLDRDYPGYNFNISDQRRAIEFIKDFDRMVKRGTLPRFLYIYQPNDHTGGLRTPNRSEFTDTPGQEVADGDVGLGMVVDHIMRSPVYYDPKTGEGTAIFVTYDDAQGTCDHIHQHRTPLVVISPYAKRGYVAKRHYSTASIVKTEELLLGLPPNNLGDLFATDLRDLFQPMYNGVTADSLAFTRTVRYRPSQEAKRIWALAARLDCSAPDRDSLRLGRLARLCERADALRCSAAASSRLGTRSYAAAQARLYQLAASVAAGPARPDSDE